MNNDQAQSQPSESEIDTLVDDTVLAEARAAIELKRRVRTVMGSIVGALLFVSATMFLSNNAPAARLTLLFTLLFGSVWAITELMEHFKKD